jgi:regulator of sigma E protease
MLSSLLYFLIALGVLVFVHELGHFLVAKWAGIRVERFSLGYPPKMIGFTWGETEYCLSWIPFGGYVKVSGLADVGAEESAGEPWEFTSKPVWVRMAVIAAGPWMNFVFAFCAFVVLFVGYGMETVDSTRVNTKAETAAAIAGVHAGDVVRQVEEKSVANMYQLLTSLASTEGSGTTLTIERDGDLLEIKLPASEDPLYGLDIVIPTTVGGVVDESPAAASGMADGDRILSVGGVAFDSWDDMRHEIRKHPAETVGITWDRRGQVMEAQITPNSRQEGEAMFGEIGIRPERITAAIGFVESIQLSATSVYNSSWLILDFIGKIFSEDRYKELGGPIRIAKMAGDTAERGLQHFLSFLALLSVNLAILNLLPIPVLDGGHLTFLTLEAIMRRPLSVKIRELTQQAGLVLLLGLMVFVTFNDLNQLVFDRIAGLFQ